MGCGRLGCRDSSAMSRKTDSRLAVRAPSRSSRTSYVLGPAEQLGQRRLQVVDLEDRAVAVAAGRGRRRRPGAARPGVAKEISDGWSATIWAGVPERTISPAAHDRELRRPAPRPPRGSASSAAPSRPRRAARGPVARRGAGSRGRGRWWARRASPRRAAPSACRRGRPAAARPRTAPASGCRARSSRSSIASDSSTGRASVTVAAHICRVSATVRSATKPLRWSSTPVRRRTSARSVDRVHPEHPHLPRAGPGQALDHLEGGGLAGAVDPEQRVDRPGRDVQVDPPDRLEATAPGP